MKLIHLGLFFAAMYQSIRWQRVNHTFGPKYPQHVSIWLIHLRTFFAKMYERTVSLNGHAFAGSSPAIILINKRKAPLTGAFDYMVRTTVPPLRRPAGSRWSLSLASFRPARAWPTRQSTGLSRLTAMPSQVRVLLLSYDKLKTPLMRGF